MDPVPGPLRDRMEVIEIPGYTENDKLNISKTYLVPRQLEANGLTGKQAKFKDEALRWVIEGYTREAGVRNLERNIGSVARAIAADVVGGKAERMTVDRDYVTRTLGPRRFEPELASRTSVPGVATGLAYTPVGGEILFIEATRMAGKGAITLTGQIGDVMKESATAAFSLVRSRAEQLGIDGKLLAESDIHIHVPAGAIPKDGPSAGVAMFTALASLLLNRPVRADVAMTGEITLRGLVLPIGGLKEKTLAATRAGIREVLVPKRNEKDLPDIPDEVKQTLKFHFVENIDQVLEVALGARARERKNDAAGAGARRGRAGRGQVGQARGEGAPVSRGRQAERFVAVVVFDARRTLTPALRCACWRNGTDARAGRRVARGRGNGTHVRTTVHGAEDREVFRHRVPDELADEPQRAGVDRDGPLPPRGRGGPPVHRARLRAGEVPVVAGDRHRAHDAQEALATEEEQPGPVRRRPDADAAPEDHPPRPRAEDQALAEGSREGGAERVRSEERSWVVVSW
jgi:hypothetical protein